MRHFAAKRLKTSTAAAIARSRPVMESLERRVYASASVTDITVNTVSDQIDPAGSKIVSLRDAIQMADASKTLVKIGFSTSVFATVKTIDLHGSALLLSNTHEAISIVGPTAGVIIDAAGANGGLQLEGSVAANVSGITFEDSNANTAIVNNGALTLTDSTLCSNTRRALTNNGTGVANLLDDTLSGNSLSGIGGGAIANFGGVVTLTNTTVADNSSTGYGGGILNYSGKFFLNNDTIANNSSAKSGGGVFNLVGGAITMANTVVAANSCSAIGGDPDVGGVINSKGYNLIGKSNGSSGWTRADLTGANADPLNAHLGSLTYNGGPTRTMLPLPGSPVINAGSSGLIPAGITTDQTGRSRASGGHVDIGATQLPGAVASAASTLSIATRYGDELVITATGSRDTVTLSQSGSTLSITADGITSAAAAPAGGVFVYTRGGRDSITISSSVNAQTTIDSIDNAPTTIISHGAHVIAWVDSTDIVSGTASIHDVASFAGGVSKALGASLPNPTDSGPTTKLNLSLLGAGPVAADVNQGRVGDCYFLAALAGFANQRPQLIQNSVVDLGDGTFAVEFYTNGQPVFVRVNNAFPVGPFDGFAFAFPGASHTIWPMVMEKAFAWFRTGANTYNSINSGMLSDVYTDLNVGSSNFSPSFSDSQLYEMLEADLQSGEPVTFATVPWQMTLVADHAYTLIGLKNVAGVNEYIVRNPWGDSGDSLENSHGIATLTYDEVVSNFEDGVSATT